MKSVILALALLTGDTSWVKKETEMFAGLTCATRQEAERIAGNSLAYRFTEVVETQTNCIFLAFSGKEVGETEDFSIGNEIFSFRLIESESHVFYVMKNKGEGYLT